MSLARVARVLSLLAVAGCARSSVEAPARAEGAPASPTSASASSTVALERARVGAPAPDFELSDLDGARVKLSSFRGKTVVLEWYNPGCPFVKASHTKGSLVDAAARHAKAGVVWLAINSSAPGKQGHGVEANRQSREAFQLHHPILLDELGTVGKAYGATRTPHLYVIDEQGTLVYRGAIDNSPDGEGDSPTSGKLVSYVDSALSDLSAKRPVATPETEPYGCSVKYASK